MKFVKSLIRNLVERSDTWIFYSYDVNPHFLGTIRIFYASWILLFGGVPQFSYLMNVPDFLFSPSNFSLGMFFSGFPDNLLIAISFILPFLYVFLLFGFYTRIVSVSITFCLIIGYTFLFSIGKIDHNILAVLFPMVMSFTNWGAGLSLDSKKERYNKQVKSWPISYWTLIVGFAMFTAGVSKINGGWLDPSTHAVLDHVTSFVVEGRQGVLGLSILSIKSTFFWEFLDYFVALFEFFFLFSIFNANVFRGFITTAVLFHVGVFLVLGIPFIANHIAYLAFVPLYFCRGNLMMVHYFEKKISYFNFIGVLTIVYLFWGILFSIYSDEILEISLINSLLIGMFSIDISYPMAALISFYIIFISLKNRSKV